MSIWQDIAQDVESKGWCIVDNALPEQLCASLHQHVSQLPEGAFKDMGMGRGNQLHIDKKYRSDKSHWLDGNTPTEQDYLTCMEELRVSVNQQLFMGLFDYEAHFAHYAPQGFYKRHLDAFKPETNRGKSNRKLTTVFYLNPDWHNKGGGELLIYQDEKSDVPFQTVSPIMNRLVVFLSDQFPHEVMPAKKDRYSIAGWFRLKA